MNLHQKKKKKGVLILIVGNQVSGMKEKKEDQDQNVEQNRLQNNQGLIADQQPIS